VKEKIFNEKDNKMSLSEKEEVKPVRLLGSLFLTGFALAGPGPVFCSLSGFANSRH